MNGVRRVIVTGSRDWRDVKAVETALFAQYRIAWGRQQKMIVVVGDCETGADAITKAWAESHQCPTLDLEEHRANWGECRPSCYHKPRWRDGEWYCPAAGPYRNQEMVDAGADICLAFPLGESHGTRDCMGRAREANIPVVDLSAPVRTGS